MNKTQAETLKGKRILVTTNGFQTLEATIKEVSPSGEHVLLEYKQKEWKPIDKISLIEDLESGINAKVETR